MVKAVGLFSGGLDSSLAIKCLLDQSIQIKALHFISPFCTCDKKGCGTTSYTMAKQLGIEFKVEFVGDEYLEIVKSPKYGYGKNLNPCIDCRILFFKKAKEYMDKIGAKFIVSGEVLGQRPKSQHRRALRIIEKEAGLEGLILRPLSAQLLPPTIPEREGWVKREKLLDIYGRTRKPQMQLAGILGIKNYPCPSGGCLLTDRCFSKRVKDLLKYGEFNLKNVELLKLGRHFRISPYWKLVVARNEEENKRLFYFVEKGDILFKSPKIKAPLGLGKGEANDYEQYVSAQIFAHYINSDEDKEVVLLESKENGKGKELVVEKFKRDSILTNWRL